MGDGAGVGDGDGTGFGVGPGLGCGVGAGAGGGLGTGDGPGVCKGKASMAEAWLGSIRKPVARPTTVDTRMIETFTSFMVPPRRGLARCCHGLAMSNEINNDENRNRDA